MDITTAIPCNVDLGLYRYRRGAHGYTAFQAFNNISAHQPGMVRQRKALLHTLIILLQSRHNVAKIRPLRRVCCPTALDQVRKRRLTTSRHWRAFILPHQNKMMLISSNFRKFFFFACSSKQKIDYALVTTLNRNLIL